MKLRNKKTGAIYKIEDIDLGNNEDGIWVGMTKYKSLAEFNEEWEDYEESKEYWCINAIGAVGLHTRTNGMTDSENSYMEDCQLEIGNYFSSREEAELAVRKLKAWKQLKDKGFKIELWDYDGGNYQERIRTGRILFRVKDYEEVKEFLDMVFGGEE